jgi:hypothetical protein
MAAATRWTDLGEQRSVSDIARELSARYAGVIRSRDITDLFYKRLLDDDVCPVVGGRRLIPRSYVPEVVDALRKQGRIGAED